jgi:hypothetical protein
MWCPSARWCVPDAEPLTLELTCAAGQLIRGQRVCQALCTAGRPQVLPLVRVPCSSAAITMATGRVDGARALQSRHCRSHGRRSPDAQPPPAHACKLQCPNSSTSNASAGHCPWILSAVLCCQYIYVMLNARPICRRTGAGQAVGCSLRWSGRDCAGASCTSVPHSGQAHCCCCIPAHNAVAVLARRRDGTAPVKTRPNTNHTQDLSKLTKS